MKTNFFKWHYTQSTLKYQKKERKKERKETILSADDIEVLSIGMRKGLAAHPQSSSVLSLCTCDMHQLLCLLTTHLLLIPTKSGFPPHQPQVSLRTF